MGKRKKSSVEETKAAVMALMRSEIMNRVPTDELESWTSAKVRKYVESYFEANPEAYELAMVSAESAAAVHVYEALKPSLLDWMKDKEDLLENAASSY